MTLADNVKGTKAQALKNYVFACQGKKRDVPSKILSCTDMQTRLSQLCLSYFQDRYWCMTRWGPHFHHSLHVLLLQTPTEFMLLIVFFRSI